MSDWRSRVSRAEPRHRKEGDRWAEDAPNSDDDIQRISNKTSAVPGECAVRMEMA